MKRTITSKKVRSTHPTDANILTTLAASGSLVTSSSRPQWQLPTGVTRGVWEYTQSDHIAQEYDEYFAENRLFEFDEQVLSRFFHRPGLVVDLGSGTGRALIGLARHGFHGVAVDLSMHMLHIVAEKARLENLDIQGIQANLVELDCIADQSADYVICLFSTLGMIRGREYRAAGTEACKADTQAGRTVCDARAQFLV